jgi:hypothetical protein
MSAENNFFTIDNIVSAKSYNPLWIMTGNKTLLKHQQLNVIEHTIAEKLL